FEEIGAARSNSNDAPQHDSPKPDANQVQAKRVANHRAAAIALPGDRFDVPRRSVGLARRKGGEDLMDKGSKIVAQQSFEEPGFRRHRHAPHHRASRRPLGRGRQGLADIARGSLDLQPARRRDEAWSQASAKRWDARRVLVEDAGAGTSLVQELRGWVSGIVAVKPEGDKASRMAVASAKFEAGQVLLPEWASWLPDLEAELFVFPGSQHDDQCDSISQALLDKNNSWMTWLSPEDWERIIARSRIPGPKPPFGRHGW
ncbi:MAG: phage terminase large subunit, partial [Methylocella sp.]